MYKKRKNNIARVEKFINSDRLSLKVDFNQLIIKDLDKVLCDYFEYKDLPNLEIIKEGGEYKVKILLTAIDLRRFGLIVK